MKKIVAMLVAGLFSAVVCAKTDTAKIYEKKDSAKLAAAAPAAKPADKK